jgi:4-amino-4-deoxychorismate lyase
MPADDGPHLVITADGSIVPDGTPVLRADDLGVLRGDGLFESLRAIDGRAELLDEHLGRLQRSATAMELALPPADDLRRGVDTAVRAWTGGPEIAIRLVVTRGPRDGGPSWYVLADPISPAARAQRRHGVSAVTLERGLDPADAGRAPWLLMGTKNLSYAVNMAAQRWARAPGADDAIFLAPDEVVLEGITSAVVIARGRELASPPHSLGILPSITVDQLFRAAAAAGWTAGFQALTVDDLHRADGVWLVSSVRRAARVHTLDGTGLPDSGLQAQICDLIGPVPA